MKENSPGSVRNERHPGCGAPTFITLSRLTGEGPGEGALFSALRFTGSFSAFQLFRRSLLPANDERWRAQSHARPPFFYSLFTIRYFPICHLPSANCIFYSLSAIADPDAVYRDSLLCGPFVP